MTHIIKLNVLLLCFRLEYAYNICHWTSSNNENINSKLHDINVIKMYKVLTKKNTDLKVLKDTESHLQANLN